MDGTSRCFLAAAILASTVSAAVLAVTRHSLRVGSLYPSKTFWDIGPFDIQRYTVTEKGISLLSLLGS